jgi:hypothetical protein
VQVRVFEGVLDRDPRRRVEAEHAVQEVQRVRVGAGEEPLERDLGHEREVAHVLLRPRRPDPAQSLLVGRAQVVQDLVELVDVVTALEEGPAAEELGQNAAYGPYID